MLALDTKKKLTEGVFHVNKSKGNAPPEDVGGEPGYEEFLEIIVDENYPKHRDMVAWGESQGYTDFDVEMVNRELEFKFK